MLAVREGQGRVIVEIPRPQIGWQSWFTATGPHMAPVLTSVWRPCPTCWGQRIVIDCGPDGGYFPVGCPTCLGLGEIVKLLDVDR